MLRSFRNSVTKFFRSLTLLSVKVIILIALFGCALIAFIYLAEIVLGNNKNLFDNYVFDLLSKHVSNVNTHVMEFFTFLGTHTFLIPSNFLLIAWFLFIKKHKWFSIAIPVISVSSLLLMFFLKDIFHRDRPLGPLLKQAAGYSFPSGHALNSFVFYGLLIFLVWQNVKKPIIKWTVMILLLLLIFAIGLSRVYLRVHYASDVLAGFSVGFMWLLLSLWILYKIEKVKNISQKED